jgi:hypothetical protein
MSESNSYSFLLFLGAALFMIKVIILWFKSKQKSESESLISRIILSIAFLYISISSIVRNGIPVTDSGSSYQNYGWTGIAIILLIAGLYYGISIFSGKKHQDYHS